MVSDAIYVLWIFFYSDLRLSEILQFVQIHSTIQGLETDFYVDTFDLRILQSFRPTDHHFHRASSVYGFHLPHRCYMLFCEQA